MSIETARPEKPTMDDLRGLSQLPPDQRRALDALVGGEDARTYVEAAKVAGMSLGTLKTHLRRVRLLRPGVYKSVSAFRRAQLAQRHREAMQNRRAHSRAYFFRRKRNWEFKQAFGFYPRQLR